jgi:hypothetical protein
VQLLSLHSAGSSEQACVHPQGSNWLLLLAPALPPLLLLLLLLLHAARCLCAVR